MCFDPDPVTACKRAGVSLFRKPAPEKSNPAGLPCQENLCIHGPLCQCCREIGSVLIWFLIVFAVIAYGRLGYKGRRRTRVDIEKSVLVFRPRKISELHPPIPDGKKEVRFDGQRYFLRDNLVGICCRNAPAFFWEDNVGFAQHRAAWIWENYRLDFPKRLPRNAVKLSANCENFGNCMANIDNLNAMLPFGLASDFQISKLVPKSKPCPLGFDIRFIAGLHRVSSASGFPRLPADYENSSHSDANEPPFGPFGGCVPYWRACTGFGLILLAAILFIWSARRNSGWLALCCAVPFVIGSLIWLTGHVPCQSQNSGYRQTFQHNSAIVPQEYIDNS